MSRTAHLRTIQLNVILSNKTQVSLGPCKIMTKLKSKKGINFERRFGDSEIGEKHWLFLQVPGIAFATTFWIFYNFLNDIPGRVEIKELQKFNVHVTKVCKRVSKRKSKRSQAGFNPFYSSKMIKEKEKL